MFCVCVVFNLVQNLAVVIGSGAIAVYLPAFLALLDEVEFVWAGSFIRGGRHESAAG